MAIASNGLVPVTMRKRKFEVTDYNDDRDKTGRIALEFEGSYLELTDKMVEIYFNELLDSFTDNESGVRVVQDGDSHDGDGVDEGLGGLLAASEDGKEEDPEEQDRDLF